MHYTLLPHPSQSLQDKLTERFGSARAQALLDEADTALDDLRARGVEVVGYVAEAGRSVVAEVLMDSVPAIFKMPVVNAAEVVAACRSYAEAGLGPQCLHGTDHYLVSERIEGRPMTSAAAHLIPQIMNDLGAVQAPTCSVSLAERMDERLHDGRNRLRALESHGRGPEAAPAYSQLEQSAISLLNKAGDLSGLCHGDTVARNIVITSAGYQVIDPEPHRGPVELDLSKLVADLGIGESDTDSALAMQVSPLVDREILYLCSEVTKHSTTLYHMVMGRI